MHIDTNDPRYRDAAAVSRRRHDDFKPEANLTSAVRDFLILTRLFRSEELVEENPPSGASRRAVDLTALDTFVEFQEAVRPLMSKGQFGARDLQKHPWKLPVPEFDPALKLHVTIADAGATAGGGAKERLAELREQYKQQEKELTVTIARRELRKWRRDSAEGKGMENSVGKLLAGGDMRTSS